MNDDRYLPLSIIIMVIAVALGFFSLGTGFAYGAIIVPALFIASFCIANIGTDNPVG